MEKEDFINNILNSVDGITSVTPSDIVLQKIEQRIKESQISTRTLWLVAASIIILVSLNIILINDKSGSNESEIASLEQSINKSNQLYK
ncbi:hypothetical protein [Flavobacterium sp.]|uniref:hypothetical protein n=1 Tax=Flavobacterium sp. TaxID=239 RepID=UPI00262D9DE5|nr:hypothetical protein [Flavobacterium sp.]